MATGTGGLNRESGVTNGIGFRVAEAEPAARRGEDETDERLDVVSARDGDRNLVNGVWWFRWPLWLSAGELKGAADET